MAGSLNEQRQVTAAAQLRIERAGLTAKTTGTAMQVTGKVVEAASRTAQPVGRAAGSAAGGAIGGIAGAMGGVVGGPGGIAAGFRAGAQAGSKAGGQIGDKIGAGVGKAGESAGKRLNSAGNAAKEGGVDIRTAGNELSRASSLRQMIAQKKAQANQASAKVLGLDKSVNPKAASTFCLRFAWLNACTFFPLTTIISAVYIDLHLFVNFVTKVVLRKPLLAQLGEEWTPPSVPEQGRMGVKWADVLGVFLINWIAAMILLVSVSVIVAFAKWFTMSPLDKAKLGVENLSLVIQNLGSIWSFIVN